MLSLFVAGNIDDIFMIHPEDGNIILAKPLDWEIHTSYNLTVTATDGIDSANAVVCLTLSIIF